MRKGHVKILEDAKSIVGFPQIYIDYLEASDLPLSKLESLFGYLRFKFHRFVNGYGDSPSEEDLETFELLLQYFGKFNGNYWLTDRYAALAGNKITKDVLTNEECIFRGFDFVNEVLKIAAGNNFTADEAISFAKIFANESLDKFTESLKQILYAGSYWSVATILPDCESVKNYSIEDKKILARWLSDAEDSNKMKQRFEMVVNAMKRNVSAERFLFAMRSLFQFKKALSDSPYFGEELEPNFVYDPDHTYEKLTEIVSKYEINNMSIKTEGTFEIYYHFTEKALTICFTEVASCDAYELPPKTNRVIFDRHEDECVDKTHGFKYKKCSQAKEKYVLFFDTLGLYKEIPNQKRLVNMSLKTVKHAILKYGTPFQEFMNLLCDSHIAFGDYIYKDVKRILESPDVYAPIGLQELEGKHSMQEVCKEKYKRDIPIDWNKGDVSINYLTYKAFTLVKKEDQGILLNFCRNMRGEDDIKAFYDFMSQNKKDFPFTRSKRKDESIPFLAYLLFKRVDPKSFWIDEDGHTVSEHDAFITFFDYINMSKCLRKKISLSFNSATKVKNAHDDVLVDYMLKTKKVPIIKIPKKSRFLRLRKMLPEEFEWITTRKRIIEEGYNMRHCVASYADYVNNDYCAIYSFVYQRTQKRYTIEFHENNGIYYISQMQSKCDRGASDEVYDYVESFLK